MTRGLDSRRGLAATGSGCSSSSAWIGRLMLLVLVFVGSSACDADSTPGQSPGALDSSRPQVNVLNPGGIVLPPDPQHNPNPLELPMPDKPTVAEEKQRVFAVPQAMLRAAQLGNAMKLATSTVVGREGENYIVRPTVGGSYQIHPAYVVVPEKGRFRAGTYVIASYGGELRHAVVKNRLRNRVTVRFTDLGTKRGDQRLDPSRIGVLPSGLAPGGYAAFLAEHEYQHVLLVSASTIAGKRRWLVIRYSGASELVSEEKLKPLPVPRFKPRVGALVLAAWRGTLVRGQVTAVDRPALLTVTRARAGAPLIIGPGMVMPAE